MRGFDVNNVQKELKMCSSRQNQILEGVIDLAFFEIRPPSTVFMPFLIS